MSHGGPWPPNLIAALPNTMMPHARMNTGYVYPLCKETHRGSPCHCYRYSPCRWDGASFESLCQRHKKGREAESSCSTYLWSSGMLLCLLLPDWVGDVIQYVSERSDLPLNLLVSQQIRRPNHPMYVLSPVTSLMQKWWIQGCVTSWCLPTSPTLFSSTCMHYRPSPTLKPLDPLPPFASGCRKA